MKMPASKTALMCFSQPELSRPSRKSVMEGERSSQTATTTQLHHWQEAPGAQENAAILTLAAQIFITKSRRGNCVCVRRASGAGWRAPTHTVNMAAHLRPSAAVGRMWPQDKHPPVYFSIFGKGGGGSSGQIFVSSHKSDIELSLDS